MINFFEEFFHIEKNLTDFCKFFYHLFRHKKGVQNSFEFVRNLILLLEREEVLLIAVNI
jgi:hypothetical protein